MRSNPPWIVRPFTERDIEGVTRLFREVFGRTMPAAHYRWKLVDSPWPVAAPNVWVAEVGDRIIGHYAGTPMRFKLGERIVPALHGCDVMTAAAWRRQGVLTALGTAAAAAWREAGVPLVTGLHYGGWGSRRHFLGWQEQFSALHVWHPLGPTRPAVPLAPRRLAGVLAGASAKMWDSLLASPSTLPSSDVHVGSMREPGSEFDVLWDRFHPGYEAVLVRDRDWAQYRYADAPHANYHILMGRRGADPVGYAVYRVRNHRYFVSGQLIDLFTASNDVGARVALIRGVVARLEEAGALALRCFVPARSPWRHELTQLGFRWSRGRFDVSIVPLHRGSDYSPLGHPSRWWTMPGDFDVW